MLTSSRVVQAGWLAGVVLVPFLIVTVARSVHAQSSAKTVRDGWVVGALVGRIRVENVPNANATAIGGSATRFTPRQAGLDLAVVTIPDLFRDGQVPVYARIGAALPIGSKDGPFLVPTVGVDAAGMAGQTSGGWVGYHVGARALVVSNRLGFQAGLLWVRAVNAPNTLWLAELGLMRVPALLPLKPRPATGRAGEL